MFDFVRVGTVGCCLWEALPMTFVVVIGRFEATDEKRVVADAAVNF